LYYIIESKNSRRKSTGKERYSTPSSSDVLSCLPGPKSRTLPPLDPKVDIEAQYLLRKLSLGTPSASASSTSVVSVAWSQLVKQVYIPNY